MVATSTGDILPEPHCISIETAISDMAFPSIHTAIVCPKECTYRQNFFQHLVGQSVQFYFRPKHYKMPTDGGVNTQVLKFSIFQQKSPFISRQTKCYYGSITVSHRNPMNLCSLQWPWETLKGAMLQAHSFWQISACILVPFDKEWPKSAWQPVWGGPFYWVNHAPQPQDTGAQ